MICRQLKIIPNRTQEHQLEDWLWMLTGVWNWAVRKIEQDAQGGLYYSRMDFQNLLAGHGQKIGIPSHVLQGTLSDAYTGWERCFKGISRKPRLKGQHNRLTSIPFPDPLRSPEGNRIGMPRMGSIRFHKQDIPERRIKSGRIIKRASGWYLCLFIDAQPNVIPHIGNGQIGIDPGFKHLLTLSTGEKIDHPRELERVAKRLAQAQRGTNRNLVSRLHERLRNQRRDRNHKLSRRLVSENELIVWSRDDHRKIAKRFGKSVTSSSHGQLRGMLSSKMPTSGRQYLEVASYKSTMTCSDCGAETGPTGLAGLSVRQWECGACGAQHDRDINAAVNTLIAGVGLTLEFRRETVSGMSKLGQNQRDTPGLATVIGSATARGLSGDIRRYGSKSIVSVPLVIVAIP